ncbi:MAG: hypothetical protein ACE5JG_06665 [Planctomycetota bacterium]
MALVLLLLAACGRSRARETQPPETPAPGREASPVLEGSSQEPVRASPERRPRWPAVLTAFQGEGPADVVAPWLPPEATWRFLVSEITTARADAAARGRPVLIRFEEDRVHETAEGGRRKTWLLPSGLLVAGGPVHLLLQPDQTVRVLDAEGVFRPAGPETPVCAGRIGTPPAGVQEFRLVVKGGREVRSIRTAG